MESKEAPSLADLRVNVVQVDYNDTDMLTGHLHGVHTLLSFIMPTTTQAGQAQKNLIDASIKAGVKRFAPSEWATYVFFSLLACFIFFSAALVQLSRSDS